MIKRILYILILSSSTLLQANADEGMWMLTDLKQQNAVAMMELGLEIPIDQVYNPNGISRITSYNVCYTKLLRSWPRNHRSGNRVPRCSVAE